MTRNSLCRHAGSPRRTMLEMPGLGRRPGGTDFDAILQEAGLRIRAEGLGGFKG